MIYLYISTILVFILFLILYITNKYRAIVGFTFDLFLIMLGICYVFFVAETNSLFFRITILLVLFLISIVIVFGLYILIILLILNARTVLKKEKLSFSNSLTLILSIALICLCIFTIIIGNLETHTIVKSIWSCVIVAAFFYFVHILVFLTSVFLCNIPPLRKNKNYIIVLGSGLINDKVSPLLAGRIDRAIDFYKAQDKKTASKFVPKLIMSGGQGSDEKIPEGEAMKNYAISKGIPESNIIVESKSKNTYENMAFSKKIMDSDSNGKPYKCIFSTSNYHVFRSGIIAKSAGLKINGIGSKTARYFLPNALLREHIAYINIYKKHLIIVFLLLFIFGFLFNKIPELINSDFIQKLL